MDLPKKYKPHEVEEHWKQHWLDTGIYKWDATRGREETFAVDTPPPTVSGSLHVGHIFSYSHQDFIVRYQRMRGKNIFFPIGWDDNGLPTERRVQNLNNVRCEPHVPYDPDFVPEPGKKKAPTPISRRNFVELCDGVVQEDEKAFKHLWTRLGMSYDWDLEYATIDERCRRFSQRSFLELLDKGEIYQDERPVMWDVDFQTAIAQAELADKEVQAAYHFFRFYVEDSDAYLVNATTRPELLAACVAVLVHPDDDRYKSYIGKNVLTPLFRVPVPVKADEKADPEKGTGVVMVCTFGDQTDVEWWRDFKLDTRQILGKDGRLMPVTFGAPGWECADADAANAVYAQIQGMPPKAAQKKVVEIAEEQGFIDRPSEQITHPVKFFEKGERPLELIPTRQWYTRIMDKKEALIAQGEKIDWHPAFMVKRFEHWVEGLNQDWCLSRQRYFGVAIPVWYKIDAQGKVRYDQCILPGVDQLPIDPLIDAPDGYTEDQRDQPGGFTGDPDVLDTWATSSLTPQIATHWYLDPERHAKLFPMDLRPQSHEIIRTWAFYTIVKAYLHDREIPWKNVVISGWILDPERKKMSKSHGNVVTPEPLVDQFGADAVRYWAARARLGVDTAYDEQVFKVGKKLCTKIFNASKFVLMRLEGAAQDDLPISAITAPTDRMIVDQLRPAIRRAKDALDAFDYAQALSIAEDFFWRTFCDNYLELAKNRAYDDEMTDGKRSALAALRLLHRAILRLFAPFIPYITEEIWSWSYTRDTDMHASIHRSPWPTLDEISALPAPEAEGVYDNALIVLDAVRKAKAEASKSMAAPVAKVRIVAAAPVLGALRPLADDISSMLNIESLEMEEGKPADGPLAVAVDVGV
ncbi:MAG: valine--tRNA ligase [Candidatus Hydrogenedentota bacterium]